MEDEENTDTKVAYKRGWREVISGTGTERVKFTCFDVDSTARCLLFGTSSGKIYVYGPGRERGGIDREESRGSSISYKFDRIVSPDTKAQAEDLSSRELSEISYDESLDACAAVASKSGSIYILHLGLRERQTTVKAHLLPAGHLHAKIDKHNGSRVTQVSWIHSKHGVLLCSGDDTGKVCLTDVTSEIMKKNKFSKFESSVQQMLKIKSSSQDPKLVELKKEWQFDAAIVQLCSTPEDTVLVSTKHATYLLHLSTNRALQLGKKPRNGFYGCCRPVRLPDTDIFNALKESLSSNTLDRYKSIYVASRPGRRLWIAVENDVKGTMKLSSGSSSSSTNGTKAQPDEEGLDWPVPVKAEEQSNLLLGQLFPYRKEIVSVSKSSISIINLEECTLKYSWSLPQGPEEANVKVRVLDSGVIFMLSPLSSQVIVLGEVNETETRTHVNENVNENVSENGHHTTASLSSSSSTSSKSLHPKGSTARNRHSEESAIHTAKRKPASDEKPMKVDREDSPVVDSHAATGRNSQNREVEKESSSHEEEILETKQATTTATAVDSNCDDKTALPAKLAVENDKKNDDIFADRDDFNVNLMKQADHHRRASSGSSLHIQTKSSSKHRRNKSGSSRRKKSTIVPISISKREDATIDGGEGDSLSTSFTFSAASTEQELDKLISSTISMTMEAQKFDKPAPQQANARIPNAASIMNERGMPVVESSYSELPPVPETTGKANVPSEELCMFLKENTSIVLDPWYSYLHIPSDQIRESLQAWEAGLSEFGAEVEMKYKIGSMEELKGAFKTLDASLVVFPLLQWSCIRKKQRENGTKPQQQAEADEILLTAYNQLHLDNVLLDSEPSATSHVQPNAAKKRTGAGKIEADIDEIVRIVDSLEEGNGNACSEALREKLLSCPTEFWCSILSGSIEVITQKQLENLEENEEALKLQRILEVMSGIGWDLIGREFAFEFLNHFAKFEDQCSAGGNRDAFRTLVRSASYHLVQMQEKELVRDGIAQSILEPIDKYLNYPNS